MLYLNSDGGSVGGTWFICVLGQLVGKASKNMQKEKKYSGRKNIQSSKTLDSQFSKKLVISSLNFQKTVRNSRIVKPYFVPCITCR